MLQTILLIVGAALAGGITALKIIAPMTKTTKDDTVLEKLEALETLLMQVHGVVVPATPVVPAPPA